ncbi:MAG TPA: hypothetical protein VJM34_01420 [Novosphingobium sp.]|nr:hypothetical protein [Novosphingobium sp.]
MALTFETILPQTGDRLIDSMTTGYRWNASSQPIRYSISGGLDGETWNDPDYVLNQLDTIFSIFDYYIAADFSSVGSFDDPIKAASGGSNINLAPESVLISEALGDNVLAIGIFPNNAFAAAYLDDIYYPGAAGDIYLNINSPANAYGYDLGEEGFALALHEIGHTLGLKHPHDHGGTDRPTFDESEIAGLNIDWLTVMSYNDDFEWGINPWDPSTPMILDVIALQYLYGPDTQTNAGDSLFRFTYFTDTYLTAYDASGNDTIDLSEYEVGAYVELPNIVISEHQVAPFGIVTSVFDFSRIEDGDEPTELIWVLGKIETLIGTALSDILIGSDEADQIAAAGGADEIFGGSGADRLDGQLGNDEIEGGTGNDTIDGGAGADLAIFGGKRADYLVSLAADGFRIKDQRVATNDGEDLVKGIEVFRFSDGNVASENLITPTPTPTTIKVFLGADSTAPGFTNGEYFGGSGSERISFSGPATGTVIDQNIETVSFNGNASAYLFQQAGNTLKVFSGQAQITTIVIQDDVNGTQLIFGSASASAKLVAGVMQIGGGTVPTSAPGAVTSTTVPAAALSEALDDNPYLLVEHKPGESANGIVGSDSGFVVG